MKARVATFEGGDAAEVQRNVEDIKARAASGPPEGVPAVGFLMLHTEGKVISIGLFDNDEDLRKGDETLNTMSPPSGSMGTRSSVEMFDVAVKIDA
jgi:hypothetical protein